ncbi:hypothetical protein CcaverHIS002_0409070 [Cutaneotrichosporon cavernicola]|uniref:Uncharacterized protein n=1 Tax=Cutaneotrichosporon cavernicola TaxID=279322 RepID=A0AA48L508_9TREE|nr:uncharacterized protein CcaverHIS019_0409010 [Cutaneotrichosporon cavernicola]BEI84303.1 hypothetical protein CcaverHIS002_0409070 [Cutaneotrichosporon cavernicola]BEI92081.1 hypothetical protein CcaverHIS019_0409010 [Cutaneotrichosporon cavernicola]
MPRNYLLSRTLDPLLGVFTGFLAYYLHETNPRTAPPPGHTLKDLVGWQVAENKQRAEEASAANAAADSAELEAVRRELDDAEPCSTRRFYVYYYSNHAWLLGHVLVL